MNLKECAFDKNAGAIVLLDAAMADHDDDWQFVTRRRIRIKIFDKREFERANIRIRFYSKDNFEYINEIRSATASFEDGNYRITSLDKKSIYTEKEDNTFQV